MRKSDATWWRCDASISHLAALAVGGRQRRRLVILFRGSNVNGETKRGGVLRGLTSAKYDGR